MLISEIYSSIQGEGRLAGVPSVFIRTSGCNLRCTWCDTPYTSWTVEGRRMNVEEVLAETCKHPARHVVLTGGEPMIAPHVEELTRALRAAGKHLTIETAGTVFKDVECDLASLSPKLANSTPHERESGRWAERHDCRRINLGVLRTFMDRFDYQLKFVVDRPEDVNEIQDLLERLGPYDREKVLLMPQGVTREELAQREPWVAGLCQEHGFRYSPRLHIQLFGNTRGT